MNDRPYVVHGKQRVRTTPRADDPWIIRLNGSENVIEKCATKRQAVERARELARNNNRPGVIIYTQDDQFDEFLPYHGYWQLKAHIPAP